MKKHTLKIIIISSISLLIVLGGWAYLATAQQRDLPHTNFQECDHVRYSSPSVEPSDKLNDVNAVQLVHAIQNGLRKPLMNDSDFQANIEELTHKSILVKLVDNNMYQMKELTYSFPYLIPEAVDMLNEIGYRFQMKMEERHMNRFKFRITSLLRTEQMQTKLCHHNRNATRSQTAHLYGTTVDISYKNFFDKEKDTLVSNAEAVQVLTKVLIEMRKECKILAVRERKQSCFHITVVVCQPLDAKKE